MLNCANSSANLCLSFLTDIVLEGFDKDFLAGIENYLYYYQRFDTKDHKTLLH